MTFQRSYHYRHKAHPRPRQVKPAEPMDTAISIEQRAEEIFFCGDPHGGFDHIIQAGKEHRPKAMVILGDLQPPAPLHEVLADILPFVDVWWIPGNHDTDNDYFYDRLWRSELAGHNLHGRVALVNGLRIAGLGGVFRGQIWMPSTGTKLHESTKGEVMASSFLPSVPRPCAVLAGASPVVGLIGPRPSLRQLVYREEREGEAGGKSPRLGSRNLIRGYASG